MILPDFDADQQLLYDSLVVDTSPEYLKAMAVAAVEAFDIIERLARVLDGDRETWLRLTEVIDAHGGNNGDVVLTIDGAMAESRHQKTVFRQLVSDIRRHSDTPTDPNAGPADDLAGMPQ